MSHAKRPEDRSGNPRSAAGSSSAPTVHSGRAPRVPAKLGDVGREIWRAVWAAGEGAYLPATDRFVIERYCELHDRRAALLREVEIDGLTTVGSTGQTVIHPALRYVESTEKELRAIETTLGLNLEARLRLGIAANAARRTTLDDILGDPDD
ncbi:phage terminase small subunit P27 family [Amycolatopsis sp. WAC 01376]|uniref:phage terminase small subunit P27 family n=1 Tax=Amycolatopsis sp. WAC 01376 TaxID=2203195 RepID=UPI000F79890F|nr:phage terminase small subunit P27 family [Amycolatopsis sp. WAC 01376]RSM66636.1 phage terminase small subunit P27 family [Amycolatopsis sp. WAC 01376]